MSYVTERSIPGQIMDAKKAHEAVERGDAVQINDYPRYDLSPIVPDLWSKAPKCETVREYFYAGVYEALARLGADELLSPDDRINLARQMLVEAKHFLMSRGIHTKV